MAGNLVGQEVDYQTSCEPEFKFAGMEYDSETGNYYDYARYYNPRLGRFMTPDPADLAAANPANPQSWNRYAYVLNNPTSLIDPAGLGPCPPRALGCQGFIQGRINFLVETGNLGPTGYSGDIFDLLILRNPVDKGGGDYDWQAISGPSTLNFLAGVGSGAIFEGPSSLFGPGVASPQTACSGTGYFTGVGPHDVVGKKGALGFVPGFGTVAIDPGVLGLQVGTDRTNRLLRQYASEIRVTPSGMSLPPGFPGSFTVSDVYGPPSARGHYPAPFDIYRFPSNAAARRITGNYPTTIEFPSSAPFVCGSQRGFAEVP